MWQPIVARETEMGELLCWNPPPQLNKQLVVEVLVTERSTRVLVDTGCTTTFVTSRKVATWGGKSSGRTIDGREVQCEGTGMIGLAMCGVQLRVKMIVMTSILEGADVVMGIDVIRKLGDILISKETVEFGVA